MTIGERIREIRNKLHITQTDFGNKIGLKQTAIGMYENNQRTVSDRSIADICREFSTNEEWLRDGTGEMFIEPTNFSLDEYAKAQDLRESEINLIRGFMELDPNVRNTLYDLFKNAFANEMPTNAPATSTNDDNLVNEIESLEEEYKKSVYDRASTQVPTASNTTADDTKKEA